MQTEPFDPEIEFAFSRGALVTMIGAGVLIAGAVLAFAWFY